MLHKKVCYRLYMVIICMYDYALLTQTDQKDY